MKSYFKTLADFYHGTLKDWNYYYYFLDFYASIGMVDTTREELLTQ